MKLVKYFSYLLLAVSAILVVVLYAQGTDEAQNAFVPVVLGWTYALVGIALVSMLVLPLFFRDGKKMQKSTLISYGIFAVVVLVAVLFSSNAPLEGVTTSVEPTANDLKFTDGGVMAAGLLIAISFISIIVGSLKNMFSK